MKKPDVVTSAVFRTELQSSFIHQHGHQATVFLLTEKQHTDKSFLARKLEERLVEKMGAMPIGESSLVP